MNTRILPLLIGLTALHGLVYVAIVHPWQAPDEYLHYEYLRLLDAKRTLALTAQDRSSAIQWEIADTMVVFEHYRYRLGPTPPLDELKTVALPIGDLDFTAQPPLYYLVSLPIYWIVSAWPALDQLYVLRIYSVILHCLTVWFTYQLAKLILPEPHQVLAIASAAVVAILPQYTFISASYNNDNLAPPLVAASLYALLKGLKNHGDVRWGIVALLCGAASIGAKRTAIGIVPLLGFGLAAYALLWWRSDTNRGKAAGALTCVILGVGAAGLAALFLSPVSLPLWLVRLSRVQGDAFIKLSSYWSDPSRLASLDWGQWLHFAVESFWGWFGWLTIPLDPALIEGLGWITLLLVFGCMVGIFRSISMRRHEEAFKVFALILLLIGLLITGLVMAAQYLVAPTAYYPQGRYFFPFISAFAILAVWGWRTWWPKQWQPVGVLLGLGLLVVLDGISLLTITSFFYS